MSATGLPSCKAVVLRIYLYYLFQDYILTEIYLRHQPLNQVADF